MSNRSQELIQQIAVGAQPFVENMDEEALLEEAAVHWADIDDQQTQILPILPEVKRFLSDVVKSVIREVADKHSQLTVVTLTLITEQTTTYLSDRMGFSDLDPYVIPLQILVAIIYIKVLEELRKRL